MSLRKTSLAIVAALVSVAATGPISRAAFVVTFQQVGSDVVATGSGSLNITGLTSDGTVSTAAYIYPSFGTAYVGPTASTNADEYSGFTGPSNFGSGGSNGPTSGSGDLVGITGFADALVVPLGYVSGTTLSDSSTWSGQTFSSLGITPGTYTWTWGTGSILELPGAAEPAGVVGDFFTLAVVPEPASLALLGVGGMSLLARRRHPRAG